MNEIIEEDVCPACQQRVDGCECDDLLPIEKEIKFLERYNSKMKIEDILARLKISLKYQLSNPIQERILEESQKE